MGLRLWETQSREQRGGGGGEASKQSRRWMKFRNPRLFTCLFVCLRVIFLVAVHLKGLSATYNIKTDKVKYKKQITNIKYQH